jgi:hypothetical protein
MPVNTKTLFVRNTQPGPTVFDTPDYPALKWEGAGDPNGGDVLPVSASILDDSQFQRCHFLGVFEIIEADQASRARMEQHAKAWQRQTQRMREITNADAGQLPTENGTVPTDERPKVRIGLGELPKTLDNEVGVIIEDDAATPKIKKARVIVSEAGAW